LSGHVLLQTLARALEWQLPNVSSLIYSPEPHHIPLERKEMKEIRPRGPTHSGRAHDGLHHLIGAIHISQYTGINEFKIKARSVSLPNNIGTRFRVDVFGFRDPTHIEAGKFFFRNLNKIEMVLTPSSGIQTSPTAGVRALDCLANMAALLSEAKDLETLSLEFSHWHPDPHSMYGLMTPHAQPIFPYMGLGTTWLKLRELTLGGLFADEEEFKELVFRHGKTLTSLKFSYCSLFSGQWSNIVDDVVFGTNIAPFELDHVNEVNVGEATFAALSDIEAAKWQYEGRVAVTGEGERFFEEPQGKSVYAWRNPDQGMDVF